MGARAAGHRANGADRAGPTSPRRGGVPSEPVRTQVIPSDRPRGRWRAAAYGPRVGGPDPADTPTKGGSRGAAPPGNLGIRTGQRPTIHRLHRCRGPNGPRASVIPAMWGSRAFLSTARNEPGTGARRMSRGSRARPLLDAPNTVDSLDDPTKDAARRPLESRNHGWDGDCPRKKWPAQSSHATRGDAALAFHIEHDLDRADIVRANVPGSGPGWRGAHFVWGGPCVDPRAHTKWASLVRPLLGPQGTWSLAPSCARARAGRGQRAGPLAPFHSSSYICSVINYISALPPAPANWSPPRARPVTRCRRARAGQLVTPAARAPGLYRSQCLRAPGQLVTPGARARPGLCRPRRLCRCVSISVCRWARPPACWSAPPPPRAPANWPPPARAPHPDPSTPGSGPPRGASHRANSASQLATALPHRALTGAPPPPSPSPSPSSPRPPPPRHPRARTPAGPRRRRPPGPYNGARARLSARYEGARAGPTPLDLDLDPRAGRLPACLPACRARLRRPFSYTYPPTPTGPQSCVQTFPGPKVVPGEPTCAGSPRASRAAMCPGQLATALRHQAAARAGPCCRSGRARGHLGRPTGVGPWRWRSEGTGRRRSPACLRRKVSGPPPSARRCRTRWWEQQGYLTAYTTRLVTSVVCRGFIPARGDIAIRQPAPGGFSPGAVASLLRAGDKAPYARGPDAVPPLPFGPVPGEGTGPNTQAVLEGSNDARTGMPPGIPGGAILHTFRTAFMLGSSAGAGPGARGLPGGRRNGGPAEATRFTYGNLVTTFTSSK
ncbi:hypothetical protein ALT_5942 [Aspergillus lentulus]|uniref:Uncharacterized protein n=1 Tax=Aspergillus lentulus TaxID=293939 RepID=A0AAN4PQN2_ASPLE|nr:hypothetical protein ALT_5942 [Aspergillus lentulus]